MVNCTRTRSATQQGGDDRNVQRICRPQETFGIVLAIIALLIFSPIAEHAHARITATQSIEVEYRVDVGEWAAFGTLIIDLAAGPRWNWTYVHDRGWRGAQRWQQHDVSVTRYFADDRSFTLGWRRKVPEGGPGRLEDTWYGILAWQWGK